MKVEKRGGRTLKITKKLETTDRDLVFEYITEPHKMTLWLAETVEKTPSGFVINVELPLHTIRIPASIIKKDKENYRFEFIWETEFVMDRSFVTFELQEQENSVKMIISEKADFEVSRWSDPKSIHIDLWKEALKKLNKLIQQYHDHRN